MVGIPWYLSRGCVLVPLDADQLYLETESLTLRSRLKDQYFKAYVMTVAVVELFSKSVTPPYFYIIFSISV